MKYFSGFCFQNEQSLFQEWIQNNDFSIAGFSYGAIKALEYSLSYGYRIDKLQLFSPAFFQYKDKNFTKLQMFSFKQDQEKYVQEFFSNAIFPSKIDISKFIKADTYEALSEFLDYKWEAKKLESIRKRGIKIEVYLGAKDKIMDPDKVLDFFLPYSDVYFMKDVGHILK
ncbi:MAG: pimelyl-ACP methyl ester esterase BioV [Sulfurospirillaceae bacterium]|nr:pimelyl-ACP methyl ester esterase BioV [Sulfurospirillaceae bacterium]